MMQDLDSLVAGFSTTPFLFVGSGLTRRYYNLPDWKGLLEFFSRKVRDDEYALISYETIAKQAPLPVGLYPKIASLIEVDFNAKWFNTPEMRSTDPTCLDAIRNGCSPFKAEVATYIKRLEENEPAYLDEVNKFKKMTTKSISGIITTNYDCFLEESSDRYVPYIGQEELVFSPIQGIAEVYKIHGCISQPDSIVINETDYIDFLDKGAYLAAKLMTTFMEYPIIFIGYSISDANIQNILSSIVKCLSNDNLQRLSDRFIFIEYDSKLTNILISPHTMNIDGKIIPMTKVALSDFSCLYEAISRKRTTVPVRVLRLFKQEFYNFTLTNTPSATLRVGAIDDPRIKDEDLVLAIGKTNEIGMLGLTGLSGNDWYRNIITDDLDFTADELLEYAYPSLIKQSNKLPLNKYLSEAQGFYKGCQGEALKDSFDNIISNSYRKNRHTVRIPVRTVTGIWGQQEDSFEKKSRLIAHLEKDEINISDLERILKEVFEERPSFFEVATTAEKSNIRRLIRIYDALKYGVHEKNSKQSE